MPKVGWVNLAVEYKCVGRMRNVVTILDRRGSIGDDRYAPAHVENNSRLL